MIFYKKRFPVFFLIGIFLSFSILCTSVFGQDFYRRRAIEDFRNKQTIFTYNQQRFSQMQQQLARQMDVLFQRYSVQPSEKTMQDINQLQAELFQLLKGQLTNQGEYIQYLEQALFESLKE